MARSSSRTLLVSRGAGALILVVSALLVVGCDSAGTTAQEPEIIWLQPTGVTGGAISSTPPPAKFDHWRPTVEITDGTSTDWLYCGAGIGVDNPVVYLLSAGTTVTDGAGFDIDGHSIDMVMVGQAKGVEFEVTATGTFFSGFMVAVGDFTLPNGMDFWDANANGVYDETLESEDYALFAFKTITLNNGTSDYFTWTNPDL